MNNTPIEELPSGYLAETLEGLERDLMSAAKVGYMHVRVKLGTIALTLDYIEHLEDEIREMKERVTTGAAFVPPVMPCELYGHDEYAPDPLSPESVCRRCGASSFDETETGEGEEAP
jgi:hypothetical protein